MAKELSLTKRIVLLTPMLFSLATSGCKQATKLEKMYSGSSTITEDTNPGDQENKIDHYLSNVGIDVRSGKNGWQTSLERLVKKKDLLKNHDMWTKEADLALTPNIIQSKIGIAYTNEKGYEDALKEIQNFTKRFPDYNKEEMKHNSSFIMWMHSLRVKNPAEIYNQIGREAAKTLKGNETIEQKVEAAKKEVDEYIKTIESEAALFGYEKGGNRQRNGDEAKDVAVKKEIEIAKHIENRAGVNTAEYEIAMHIYDSIIKTDSYSRLAPQAIKAKAELYEMLADKYVEGKLNVSGKKDDVNQWNWFLDKSKETWHMLDKVPFRGSRVKDYMDAAIKKIEAKQADVPNKYK